jgi:hypothetical protein
MSFKKRRVLCVAFMLRFEKRTPENGTGVPTVTSASVGSTNKVTNKQTYKDTNKQANKQSNKQSNKQATKETK